VPVTTMTDLSSGAGWAAPAARLETAPAFEPNLELGPETASGKGAERTEATARARIGFEVVIRGKRMIIQGLIR